MLKVFSCVADQHNHGLVLIAGVICLMAAFTALFAFHHALDARSRRGLFVVVAALSAGLGIWAEEGGGAECPECSCAALAFVRT